VSQGTGVEPSVTVQRYAAELYRLQEGTEYVSIADLADSVDVSLQAATRMVKRLEGQGYLAHEPYQGVRLTPPGERVALRGVRRHRLAELFLVRVMGFGWDEVHTLTDTFEWGVTDEIEARIDELLGHPTRCPHGEPIPTPDGSMPALADRPLVELDQGSAALISRVRVHDPARLRYLKKLGLVPGVQIHFVGCAPFEGPVRVLVGPVDQVISYQLASALWVESVS